MTKISNRFWFDLKNHICHQRKSLMDLSMGISVTGKQKNALWTHIVMSFPCCAQHNSVLQKNAKFDEKKV